MINKDSLKIILIITLIILVILYLCNKSENFATDKKTCNKYINACNKDVYLKKCKSNPTGSYLHTCRDCEYSKKKDMLFCNCQDVEGFDVTTMMENASKCSNIVNINGYLTCDNPLGNYVSTCTNCHVDNYNDSLTCDCKNKINHDKKTTLYKVADCANIENIDGELKCIDTREKMPNVADHSSMVRTEDIGSITLPGNFNNTCFDCRYHHKLDQLECVCIQENGLDKTTILHNASKCKNIENHDGNLTCA
jgi:hypothetical protein